MEPAFPFRRAIHIEPPKFGLGEPRLPKIKIFVLQDGYRVILPDQEPITLAKVDAQGSSAQSWDLAGLAQQAKAAAPDIQRAVVSAENDIPVEVLMATYSALLGPDCKQTAAEQCFMSHLMIEAGAG